MMLLRVFGAIAFVLLLPSSTFAQTMNLTCDAFVDYYMDHGVTANGTEHPVDASWTTAHFSVTVTATTVTFTENKGKVQCYKGEAEMLITASPTTSRLDWVSTDAACDTCACKAEQDKYTKALDKRVAAFEKAARDLANQKTGWTDPSEVCIRTTFRDMRAAAKAAFDKKANEMSKRIADGLQRFYLKTSEGYANTLDAVVSPPNCAACKPCGPGQTPTCTVCPAGQVVYQNQCVSTCGPLVDDPLPRHWQNCGINTVSQQPVNCCNVKLTPSSPDVTPICSVAACPPP